MTTTEILSAFLKGNEIASISDKQRNWLLSQAKKECVKMDNDGHGDRIFFNDCHYIVRNCRTHVAGYGGTRGTKVIPGRYNLEKMYSIKFDLPPYMTQVCKSTDMDHYKREGHPFSIINQLK